VPRGSFFGLVGPNGTGKTTLLSMAVGLLRPAGGQARILGVDVWADPVRAEAVIGVLPDELSLPEQLTGRELLTYLGLLRGLPEATVAERADELPRCSSWPTPTAPGSASTRPACARRSGSPRRSCTGRGARPGDPGSRPQGPERANAPQGSSAEAGLG
jgi:energy-coupling factor transporter ATP-binding protein EcfA2